MSQSISSVLLVRNAEKFMFHQLLRKSEMSMAMSSEEKGGTFSLTRHAYASTDFHLTSMTDRNKISSYLIKMLHLQDVAKSLARWF